MELPRFFPNAKQSQVTLVAQDTTHGLDPSPLKAFQRTATSSAMKTIKNLFSVPPGSHSHLACQQCKKSFKPSDHEQVYCSVNCSRMESWLAMNKAHIAKQRALHLRQCADTGSPDAKRTSLAPSQFSSLEKLVAPRPTTAPHWRTEFTRRPSSKGDASASPRRVLRKRSKSTSSALTLCSLPPPLPPSTASSSPQRMSRRISQTPSQTSTVVADPFYHPDPHEHSAYTRLVLQNRSTFSLALPPRPRCPSSAAVPTTPRTPFLVRKPHHPIPSRPSTIPGPLATPKSITLCMAGGAPPTPPPDTVNPPARLRAGFDRRATRPRSNSFGGFGSLAIHATAT